MPMRLRTLTVAAGVVAAVFAAVAVAAPRPVDAPPITLTDEQLQPIVSGLIPNCGDPVPWRFALDPRVVPPPGAMRLGGGAYLTTHDNVVHIPMVVVVKNVGRRPAGDGGQSVVVSERPTRGGPTTQLLQARFRALRAGEAQDFPFEMQIPFPGPGRRTVTATLDYLKPDSFTPPTADCVMTNNKLSRTLFLW